MRIKGNRQIRWYQQRTQGSYSKTELKKMLIVAETLTRSQHRKSSIQFVFVDLFGCDIWEFSNIWR
jgi:hypothetical protein